MLPHTARLCKTRDFKEVFGKGKGVKDGRLFLKAAQAKNEDLRFGIVVSKQVAAKAVDRNRLKRLLREAVQDFMPQVRTGYHIILVALPGLSMTNLQDAKTKVAGIIKKSSLFQP